MQAVSSFTFCQSVTVSSGFCPNATDVSKKEEKGDSAADKRFTTVWKLIEVVSDNEDEDDVTANKVSETKESSQEKAALCGDASSYELAMKTQRDDADVAESLIKLSGQNDALNSTHLREWNPSAVGLESSVGAPSCVSTSASSVAAIPDRLTDLMTSMHPKITTNENLNMTPDAYQSEGLKQNSHIVHEDLCRNKSEKLLANETDWEKRNGKDENISINDEGVSKYLLNCPLNRWAKARSP